MADFSDRPMQRLPTAMAIKLQQRRDLQRNQNKFGRLSSFSASQLISGHSPQVNKISANKPMQRQDSDTSVFTQREQTPGEFPRAVQMFNLGIKKQLNQQKAVLYFKEKAREIRQQNREVSD